MVSLFELLSLRGVRGQSPCALLQWQAAYRVWANFIMSDAVIESISQRLDEVLK